jgi:hypothetical protein
MKYKKPVTSTNEAAIRQRRSKAERLLSFLVVKTPEDEAAAEIA